MRNKFYIKKFKFEENSFIYKKKKNIIKIPISNLNEGLNITADYFINKSSKNFKIYSRICDHNYGKLFVKQNTPYAVCPFHNWKLDPSTGKYININLKKEEENYQVQDDCLLIRSEQRFIKTKTFDIKKSDTVKISYLNHACLLVEGKNISFATDPWLLGPAFHNAWWLKKASLKNSIEKINSVDFIFISHNHPDHLHAETLKKISKDKIIITPNFFSKCTKKVLNDLGFKNILELDFSKEYFNSKLNFSFILLKSGDFREDSGIYFKIGSFSTLLNVDCNNLNFGVLPNKVSLYGSSYAGGASGYPICFDMYNENQKKEIIKNNLNSLFNINLKRILTLKPKYFIPYAGSFEEKAERDNYIFKNNLKNNILKYKKQLAKKTEILDTDNYNYFEFSGNQLKLIKNIKLKTIKEKKVNYYINKDKKIFSKINLVLIKRYFINSNFRENLYLIISLTDDHFKKNFKTFSINFSAGNRPLFKVHLVKFKNIKQKAKVLKKNVLFIRARKEVFLKTIKKKLPWDDMLIGFQVKINRIPDIYNNNFWHYFSNVYIGEKYTRQANKKMSCNDCKVLEQNLNKELIQLNA